MPVVDRTSVPAEGCWMPVVLLPPEGHWIFYPFILIYEGSTSFLQQFQLNIYY